MQAAGPLTGMPPKRAAALASTWDWSGMYDAYVLDEHDEHVWSFKESAKKDREAWTIVSALILTICIPASMIGTLDYKDDNLYNKEVSYVYTGALCTCAAASILSIWNATNSMLRINALPPRMVPQYLRSMESLRRQGTFLGWCSWVLMGSALWANIAFLAIVVLIVSAVYLYYGGEHLIIAIPIMATTVVIALSSEAITRKKFVEVMSAAGVRPLHGPASIKQRQRDNLSILSMTAMSVHTAREEAGLLPQPFSGPPFTGAPFTGPPFTGSPSTDRIGSRAGGRRLVPGRSLQQREVEHVPDIQGLPSGSITEGARAPISET